MFSATLFILCCYVTTLGSGHPGSPWNSDDNEYYYESLDPQDTLPTISSTSQNLAVLKGESVVLPCDVHNLGAVSLTWRRGKQILWVLEEHSNGSFFQAVLRDARLGHNGTSLTLARVEQGDQGVYTCEIATNPIRSINHTLNVKVPPSVYPVNNRTVVTVKMGGTITLTCHVFGNPTPTLTWSRKGGNLPGPADGATLTLVEAVPEDNGVYRCTASNGVGEPASATITLQVMHPPKSSAEKEEVYSGVNYDATLACYVDAEPRAQVRWYRVGGIPVDPLRLARAVDAHKRYSLQFDHVHLDDFGDYTCNATNFMGNSSAVIRLSGRPKPVRFFSSSQGDKETSYALMWEVESYAPILTYNIAYRNESDVEEQWVNFTVPGTTSSSKYHSKSHTFSQLDPGGTYSVQVSAINEFGESDVKETFTFTTFDPAGGTDSPEDYQAEGESTVPVIDHSRDVVSEVVGQTESHETPLSGVEESSSPEGSGGGGTVGNVTEVHQSRKKEVLSAETMAVQDDSSDAFSFTLTPAEKRAQMVALLTAISLSCFFL